MSDYAKPVPVADADSEPFWAACRDGALRLQRCTDCGAFRYPPAARCADCGSDEAKWTELSGRGKVFSWITVTHPVPKDMFAADVPYVVALIDLEEGVRMASNIVGCAPDDVTPEMAVEVVFDQVSDGVTLPKFRPAGPG